MKSIEYKGNVHRFHGQKSGKLIDVEERLAREISCVVSENIGKEIPKNSVTRFIVLTFIGEKGVPFQDLIRYGAARKTSLVKDIGKWFDIDSPTTEEQVEIELKAQEVKE